MKQYLYSKSIEELPVSHCDVLVVGAGIAGLYAALELPSELNVTIATKVGFDMSNSYLAQGGIASVIDSSDRFDSHIEDTLKAGAGECDLKAVTTLVKEGPENIRHLVDMLVPFDKKDDGSLMITREGGHSCRRIVHCGGDATGREVTKRLTEIALTRDNITILQNTNLIDILTENGAVVGALLSGEKDHIVSCSKIILATGGIGALYEHTTNPSGAVGDGIAAAARAGAKVVNMEFVQFHPTTMIPQSGQTERRFLISEAVRGEGGILKNHLGEAFMQGKHPLADLAPRDIVTREILHEMRRTGEAHVFLDVSAMSEEFFAKRFPTIYGECKKYGIDIPRDMIPVEPAQHYLMGGIETDIDARTCVKGLYACGECAWTGVHGANRLASNSMLECLVFGRKAARSAANDKFAEKQDRFSIKTVEGKPISDEYIETKRSELRAVMTENLNAVRTPSGMAKAKDYVDKLLAELDMSSISTKRGYELYSLSTAAKFITDGALAREKSVGAHYVEYCE